MVGKILQKLSKNKNITILCTVHQPRYALAKMFDKIYFLAKGNEIYFGPTIPKCLKFFKNAGYKCPEVCIIIYLFVFFCYLIEKEYVFC